MKGKFKSHESLKSLHVFHVQSGKIVSVCVANGFLFSVLYVFCMALLMENLNLSYCYGFIGYDMKTVMQIVCFSFLKDLWELLFEFN